MMGEKKLTRRCCARQAFIGENSVLRQRGGAHFCDVKLVLAAKIKGSRSRHKVVRLVAIQLFPQGSHCSSCRLSQGQNFCYHRGYCSFCDRRLTTSHQPISLYLTL